ncbi:hypothetical protein P3G55_26050, partial [Leptospira sp. 96542]|nr:hypothetical protein [Leptospira sp. 96542]
TSWPRLDDAHRRTVWGRVLMRLDDARLYEQAVRRRSSLRRAAAPMEPPPESTLVDEVLLVADSGAPIVNQAGQAQVPPLQPDLAHMEPSLTESGTDAQAGETAIGPGEPVAAQPVSEDPAAVDPFPAQAPGEPSAASPSVPDALSSGGEAGLAPASQTPAAGPAMAALSGPLAETSETSETLMHAGVPVDVAAARARQVRLAMAQVVQASLENARQKQAQPAQGPEEIILKNAPLTNCVLEIKFPRLKFQNIWKI